MSIDEGMPLIDQTCSPDFRAGASVARHEEVWQELLRLKKSGQPPAGI